MKYYQLLHRRVFQHVVPLVGTWIEIYGFSCFGFITCVVPLVGTWIEIMFGSTTTSGLAVVPLVGTWIEIPLAFAYVRKVAGVVPLVGTWIEI